MIMKWYTFKPLLFIIVLLSPVRALADTINEETNHTTEDSIRISTPEYSKYDKRIHRFRRNWNKLIPTHNVIQYAGNMGMFSLGTGWDYGKRDQWETDILFGFIPKHDASRTKITMTLKQSYIPWSLELKDRLSVEPLSCGIYFNTVFGNEFWVHEPERYPEGYYGFSSKIRTHIFLGQRLTYDIDKERRFMAKSISLFYELSTCDLLLISRVTNKYLKARDYLSLSFGIKFQWL